MAGCHQGQRHATVSRLPKPREAQRFLHYAQSTVSLADTRAGGLKCAEGAGEDLRRKGVRAAHQVTCNPAAPCSHQAGLRTYKAQLRELKFRHVFPLAQ